MILPKCSNEALDSPEIALSLVGNPEASNKIKITVIKIRNVFDSMLPRPLRRFATSFNAALGSKSLVRDSGDLTNPVSLSHSEKTFVSWFNRS